MSDQPDLFGEVAASPPVEAFAPGAMLLRGFASPVSADLLAALAGITGRSPFRRMMTPGGFTMSVAMTNAGEVGWITDRRGYRYGPLDPDTGLPWPAMPECFRRLAANAADAAGYAGFEPDGCLINRYEPGSRLSAHQDRNERDLRWPIVSVSLGLPATFLFGGASRTERMHRLRVVHGDVAVWGGPSRLAFHGVAPLPAGTHPATGGFRYNLTFRRAR